MIIPTLVNSGLW